MNLVAQRGSEILNRLPADRPLTGAEVGVWDGRLSEWLLATCDRLTLHLVDRWCSVPDDHRYLRSNSQMARSSDEQFDRIRERAERRVSRFGTRAVVHQGESLDVAREFANELDFAFIDADHSYEGVSEDIAAWSPWVKPGGWLCGHDWEHPDHLEEWGVRRAVEEFAGNRPVETGRNRTWFVQL